MPETAVYIGAFVRWLFKLCKTNLRDELEGNFNPVLLDSYTTENFWIGIIFTVIIIGTLIWTIF
jgi:hypothetical protein